MNGRTALGAGLAVLAVLAGALFLDRSQRLVPVYAAARDLPAGTSLQEGDLVVIRARLPASALRQYLRPSAGRQVAGAVLTAPVRRETLVPAGVVLASSRDADLVELPVQVDPGDMAQGLRPGDNVQVLAAYTEGARRCRAVVLLPTAEVVRVLQDPAGLTGAGQDRGVQLRMSSDRAPIVAAAIATARIFVVKAPGLAVEQPSAGPTPGGAEESPADLSEPEASPPSTSQSGTSQPGGSEPGGSQAGASAPDVSEPEASPPGGGQPTPTSEDALSRAWSAVTQPASRSVR
jgi:SAF domain-containing protein